MISGKYRKFWQWLLIIIVGLSAMKLLAAHKSDESEYVRKSVGNAIRDISKKHSKLVSAELSTWDLSSKEIRQFYKLASKSTNLCFFNIGPPCPKLSKLNTSRHRWHHQAGNQKNGFLLFLCPDAGRKEVTIRHATMPAL